MSPPPSRPGLWTLAVVTLIVAALLLGFTWPALAALLHALAT
ncbi:hypothetical protein [Deinococcus apachensis]|nr:hypothetical protein [Deinococcus apachensis]